MATTIRAIGHEDRLSLVDHLDELRTRLILSGIAFAIVFGFCLWQNHALLHIINKPLKTQTQKQVAKGEGTVGQAVLAQQGLLKIAGDTRAALGVLAAPGSGPARASSSSSTAAGGAMATNNRISSPGPLSDRRVLAGVGGTKPVRWDRTRSPSNPAP